MSSEIKLGTYKTKAETVKALHAHGFKLVPRSDSVLEYHHADGRKLAIGRKDHGTYASWHLSPDFPADASAMSATTDTTHQVATATEETEMTKTTHSKKATKDHGKAVTKKAKAKTKAVADKAVTKKTEGKTKAVAGAPRPGTLFGLVVELAKAGKTNEEILAVTVKKLPDVKMSNDPRAVSWYRWKAKQNGWL